MAFHKNQAPTPGKGKEKVLMKPREAMWWDFHVGISQLAAVVLPRNSSYHMDTALECRKSDRAFSKTVILCYQKRYEKLSEN